MTFSHPAPLPAGALFVLLSDDPDVPRLADALRTVLEDVVVSDAAADGTPADAHVVTGRLGPDTVVVAPGTGPVPDEEAVAACHPVWWDDPAPVARHRGHVVVLVRSGDPGDEDLRARALRHAMAGSVAAAALLGEEDAVGVYAGSADATFPAEAYREQLAAALQEHELPAYLWVTTWLEPHEDGTLSGWTSGLLAFGHAELVIEDSTREPADVYHLLDSLAAHAVMTGDRLEPGHTVGWADGVHPVVEAADSSDTHPLLAINF